MQQKKIFFPDLDILRTVACLFVLVAHIFWDGIEAFLPDFLKTSFFHFVLGNGGLGVQIFFMLSGFLISYLLLQEENITGRINVKNFYIRRILRIWPLYYLILAFVFILYPILKHYTGVPETNMERPLYYIFFVGNFDVIRILSVPGAFLNSMSAITWSVAIEEQFYVFWPLLFILFKPKNVVWAMMGIFILSSTFILISNLGGLQIYYHTLPNFLFLSSGGILAWLYTFKPETLQKLIKSNKALTYTVFIALLLILIYAQTSLTSFRPGFLLYWIMTAATIALLILIMMLNPASNAKRHPNNFWVTAGKYTYGLYMYHRIAQWGCSVLFKKIFPVNTLPTTLLEIVACFAIAILMSVVSYNYFEKPVLNLKKKFALFVKN